MGEGFEIRLLRYTRRHLGEVIASVYLLGMVWLGLVPFDFGPETKIAANSGEVLGLPVTELHLPDMLANVALYLPLGVLLRAALRRVGWGVCTSFCGTIFLGGVISYATEFSQLLSPSRISAASDWICNTAGTAIGASLHGVVVGLLAAFRAAGRGMARAWRDRLRRRPSAALAQLMAAIIVLAAVAPLDLTFSPNRIRDSLHDINVAPFAKTARLSTTVSPVTAPNRSAPSAVNRERWQLMLDHAWTLAAYALLGICVQRYLTVHCRMGALAASIWTAAAAAMLALGNSLAQIFIISRGSDITYVLLGVVGAVMGAMLAEAVVHAWRPTFNGSAPTPAGRRGLVTLALIAGCVYIAARELAPFETNISPASIHSQIAAIEWLPMRMYQRTRLPIAIDDLVSKLGRYFFLAVGICLWRRYRHSPPAPQGILATAVSVAFIVAGLEAIQLLMPVRHPALTDVLLSAVATAGGVIAFRIATVYLGLVGADRIEAGKRVIYNVTFGPDSTAPIERIARRRDVHHHQN